MDNEKESRYFQKGVKHKKWTQEHVYQIISIIAQSNIVFNVMLQVNYFFIFLLYSNCHLMVYFIIFCNKKITLRWE